MFPGTQRKGNGSYLEPVHCVLISSSQEPMDPADESDHEAHDEEGLLYQSVLYICNDSFNAVVVGLCP